MLKRDGLHVELHVQEQADTHDEPVKALFFNAIQELLCNVLQHAGVTHARVNVRREDHQLLAEVADQGKGFDPAHLKSEGGSAAGFGLFGIRETLAVLRGSLEITSSPGHGSRVVVRAPLATLATLGAHQCRHRNHQHLQKQHDAPDTLPNSDPLNSPERSIRVLLVDDHRIVLRGLEALLRSEHDLVIVGQASNGREALQIAHQVKPQVILMDVAMPQMNGIEATRLIKADMPHVRVIGLSMFDEDEMGLRMKQAGAAAFLNKAGPTEALLAAIRDSRDDNGQYPPQETPPSPRDP